MRQVRRPDAELVASTRSFLLFLPIDHFQAAPLGSRRRLLPAPGAVAVMRFSYFWHDLIPRSQSNFELVAVGVGFIDVNCIARNVPVLIAQVPVPVGGRYRLVLAGVRVPAFVDNWIGNRVPLARHSIVSICLGRVLKDEDRPSHMLSAHLARNYACRYRMRVVAGRIRSTVY